ncbi:MAG: carbohydrate-binding protein [bacterium]|nr:carbohydrate-binding protein [bacterium]
MRCPAVNAVVATVILIYLVAGPPAQTATPEPLIVGEVNELERAYESPKTLEVRTTEALVWQQELSVEGASYIAPHFSYFNLPEGARLVVRAPDNSRSWTFTGRGKAGYQLEKGFWGVHILGDTALVELYSRVLLTGKEVKIDRISHGYSQGKISDRGSELTCVDDSCWAQCYEESHPEIYNKSRAVAFLLIHKPGRDWGCTGWLVGDQGHLMTNSHCIETGQHALDTDYVLMKETAYGDCGTCGGLAFCGGKVEAVSANYLSGSSTPELEYALVQLPQYPGEEYGFLRLRESGPVQGEPIYIPGHPNAECKRIAVRSKHVQDQGYCAANNLGTDSLGVPVVNYYCDTRLGSSGSPVLSRNDHLVVALHYGEDVDSSCMNRGTQIQAIHSDLVRIGVDLPSTAFDLGIPGLIEAESYGFGGAYYYDTTPGNNVVGQKCRNPENPDEPEEDVDLQLTADGGCKVVMIADGEWLKYGVRVDEAGYYDFDVRVAAPRGRPQEPGALHFEIDDEPVTDVYPFATPIASPWRTVTATRVMLEGGDHKLALHMDSGGWNLDWFRVRPSPVQAPYGDDGPHLLPGRIEAENYDVGGLGVAYHDTTRGNVCAPEKPCYAAAYRFEDVDVWRTDDSSGGYHVGQIEAGEWLEYTVELDQPEPACCFAIHVRVAGAEGGRFRIELDGKDVTGSRDFPPTPWTSILIKGLKLEIDDPTRLRFYAEEGDFKLNWIEVEKTD